MRQGFETKLPAAQELIRDLDMKPEQVGYIGDDLTDIPLMRYVGLGVSVADAPAYVFGVTAGNDVSERGWQASDLQWLRAKASDGFAPVGPAIATGLDYKDLLIETRLNGTVQQSESSKFLIHDVDEIVSFTSRYITLEPGDLIFRGTPGRTRPMKPGDVVEITIQGVGTLRNKVVAD